MSSLLSLSLNACAVEADELEKRCNQCIEEVMKSPKEYTTYNLQELQISLKGELLKILKKYDVRPTKIADFQHGFSTKLQANKRLIVLEEDDQTKCREYSAYRTHDQFCLQCRSLTNHKVLIYAKIIHGILFVPVKHLCEPKEYALVMGVQEKLKEGDLSAALSLQRKYAVKKHPKFLNASEKTPKRPKASTTSSSLLKLSNNAKENTVAASATGENLDKMNSNNDPMAKADGSLAESPSICSQLLTIVRSPDVLSPPEKRNVYPRFSRSEDSLGRASTSNIESLGTVEFEETENAVAKNDMNETNPAITSSSAPDPLALAPLNDPSQLSSSLTSGVGGRGKGRKRGSKNLVFAKNSLDLIDAIKCLLPPEEESSSAPKKRRRRRKASIQAALEEAAATKDDDDNIDLIPSTNATATILDMIDMELATNEKYASENSSTTDAEHTDDCEIIEENLYLSIQNDNLQSCYCVANNLLGFCSNHIFRYQAPSKRTRTETITIDD